jgi:hypothetical protein
VRDEVTVRIANRRKGLFFASQGAETVSGRVRKGKYGCRCLKRDTRFSASVKLISGLELGEEEERERWDVDSLNPESVLGY